MSSQPPVRSLWLQEALAEDETNAPRLQGDVRADACIVGGGYTGMWTALRLKEIDPTLDVALVEADVCGGGASGRNGGVVLSRGPEVPPPGEMCGGGGRRPRPPAPGPAAGATGGVSRPNRDHQHQHPA